MNTRKFHLPGEAALLIVLLINPLAIDLMSKSVFGISTISSVPLILSTAFPVFSFGTWNYLFSFVVGIGFGKMIDVHNTWVTLLPNVLSLNVVCFFTGFLLMCFGICLANNCLLPIVPTDIFPRDLSELLHKKYNQIKTTFDLTCLTTTVILSLVILHHLYGIGIGTFFCAFMTGRTVSLVQKFIGNHVEFYRLTKKEMVMPGKKMRHA